MQPTQPYSQSQTCQRIVKHLLLDEPHYQHFEQTFLNNLKNWKQHQTQQAYYKAFLDLLKELLVLQQPISKSQCKAQITESNQNFFKVIHNLSRVLLQKYFLPQKTDFIQELYSFAMKNFTIMYEEILNLQKKDQLNQKTQKIQKSQGRCPRNGNQLNVVKRNEVRQAIHRNQHYKQKLNIAYHFFSLLLLSHKSLALIQGLIGQCTSNIYRAVEIHHTAQPLPTESLIFFRILESLFETLRKVQLKYLKPINQRLEHEKVQLETNAFANCVIQFICKIFTKKIPMQKQADFIPLIKAIKKIVLLMKAQKHSCLEKEKAILQYLVQKSFLRGDNIQCIGAIASCLEIYLNDTSKHFYFENKVFDFLVDLQIRSIRNLPLLSLQVTSFYEKCLIRLSARALQKTLQRNHSRLVQKILKQVYDTLPVESDEIVLVRCKLRLYQMIQTYFKIKDQTGFFSKMVNVLRQKKQSFSPQQFLFQGICGLYSENDLHSVKDKISKTELHFNNGQRGSQFLPYMKSLKLAIEKFRIRMGQNYKFYAEKLKVSDVRLIFDDPVSLETFYSGILLEACSVHLFLSKIPFQLGVQDSQTTQLLFIYFYNAIAFFPSPRRISKNNFPKDINLGWLSQNVSRYIAEVLTLLIEKHSVAWQQNGTIPFFQDLNLTLLINSFTVEAVKAIQSIENGDQVNTQHVLGNANSLEGDPLALAQPMCTVIFCLLDKFHFYMPLQEAIKIFACLKKLTLVVKNWKNQDVPYKEPLFTKLCTLAVKILNKNQLKKAYNNEGVLKANLQQLGNAAFTMLDTVLQILSNKQRKPYKLKNPQKYFCFINLFNELSLSFGKKYITVDGKSTKMIIQNPFFATFCEKVLACDGCLMESGFQNYNSLTNVQNYNYKILLSEILTNDWNNYSKFLSNPLLQAESFEAIQNRQLWLKTLQLFRYMMISQMFNRRNQTLNELIKFLTAFNGKMQISQQLKGQQTIIELFINRLECQQSNSFTNSLSHSFSQPIDSFEVDIIQLVQKQIEIINQTILLYFPTKSINSDKLRSQKVNDHRTIRLSSKGNMKTQALHIADYVQVLNAVKSISYLLTRLIEICQRNSNKETNNETTFSREFNQLSQTLSNLKTTVRNLQILSIEEHIQTGQFNSLKTIIQLSLNYSLLIIQQKWFPLMNGTKAANKFRLFLKQTPQDLKNSQLRKRRGNENIYQPTLEHQYDELRKSYKQKFQIFFESPINKQSQHPQFKVSIRPKKQ